MGDHGRVWVRLDEWLVGDKYIELVPTGGVLELSVLATGRTLRPAQVAQDDIRAIDGRDPTHTGKRAEAAYWLTGVAGPAEEPLWQPRGAMFIVSVGTAPILTRLTKNRPSDITAGSRVTVDCTFSVLDGYDEAQLDEDLETTAAWRVLDQRPVKDGYLLDLEPA